MNAALQPKPKMKKKNRRKMAVFSLVFIVLAAAVFPFSGFLLSGGVTAQVHSGNEFDETNPRSEYWREVRDDAVGYTSVRGQETAVLIQNSGQNWRQLRNGIVSNVMPWLLLAAAVALVLFYLFCGVIKVDKPLSGRKVLRWKLYERTVHWITAIGFVLLTITGLSLLFGRAVLIPVLGKDNFAAFAALAKDIHNYVGPVFCLSLALLIIGWIKDNIPNRHDWEWIKSWGGMIGGDHPPAGRMNGGEKIWFWVIATVGVAVCVSGLLLDFPNFGQERIVMQWADLVHAAFSILWICVALGHIYLGTVGTEGTLEGMTTGYVSEEWARQHHELWTPEKESTDTSSAPATKPG